MPAGVERPGWTSNVSFAKVQRIPPQLASFTALPRFSIPTTVHSPTRRDGSSATQSPVRRTAIPVAAKRHIVEARITILLDERLPSPGTSQEGIHCKTPDRVLPCMAWFKFGRYQSDTYIIALATQ
jgi:hypothetical protein